jgi:hypothetical protein
MSEGPIAPFSSFKPKPKEKKRLIIPEFILFINTTPMDKGFAFNDRL